MRSLEEETTGMSQHYPDMGWQLLFTAIQHLPEELCASEQDSRQSQDAAIVGRNSRFNYHPSGLAEFTSFTLVWNRSPHTITV